MMRVVTFIFSLIFAVAASGFEMAQLSFDLDGEEENKIVLSFRGLRLDPPLNLLSDGIPKSQEIMPFYDFLKLMYRSNLDGAREKILDLWNPDEREGVSQLMTDDAIQQNKGRFTAVKKLDLEMIMAFGDKYICFVRYDFGDSGSFMFKTPLLIRDGKLYLTNTISGNYFYDQLADHILH